MAKFYGSIAKKGRVGGSVFRIRGGETIESQYQPNVNNPSTPAQVSARARMKLLSQLAAVMATVIAMRKKGNVTSRNLFVKENYGLSTFSNEKAEIVLSSVQLTKSVVGFPAIGAIRQTEAITAYIGGATDIPTPEVDRVVYCEFDKQVDGKLRFLGSEVVTAAGNDGAWRAVNLPLTTDEVVILAYGIRDNNQNAKVVFGNLETITAQAVAQLVVTSRLTDIDVTLTETRGYTLPAATQS